MGYKTSLITRIMIAALAATSLTAPAKAHSYFPDQREIAGRPAGIGIRIQ